MKMSCEDGIELLAAAGILPDCIYVDASHHYDMVLQDLTMCLKYFPDARICGDDWGDLLPPPTHTHTHMLATVAGGCCPACPMCSCHVTMMLARPHRLPASGTSGDRRGSHTQHPDPCRG